MAEKKDKNKIFNKKIRLVLAVGGVLMGLVMLSGISGITKGSPAEAESSSDWDAKPVVVNIHMPSTHFLDTLCLRDFPD